MDLVIRPVNDRFLREVAFPAFETGRVDARQGLTLVRSRVADEQVGLLLDTVIDSSPSGGFDHLDQERWLETVYRLLFSQWEEDGAQGWRVRCEATGFAATFDESLSLALLLEEPCYPYSSRAEAENFRADYLATLPRRDSLSALVCGAWEPLPPFAPDEVLSTQSRGVYQPAEGLAVAEWSFRTAEQVARMKALLPDQLKHLLERERARLAPLPLPDGRALLSHWLDGKPAPALGVAFSGLGAQASQWAIEMGVLVNLIRSAAENHLGLSVLMTGPVTRATELLDGY